ncbi:hypothetical protein M7I_8168 [Glarea lozoyensis 74030]|uniref:Uncharacterized protein n=1 Tax=Glarea lozoyensis (strain ATCC 74030 / MF5533) TaxID=1104152 RepID=H0EZA5_GLAL7|nr:hypothetical protein M7I_8168 [Glarea lozoyensis 74030]
MSVGMRGINLIGIGGSTLSMGGNGAYVNHTGVLITGTPAPYDVIPPDQGGGCVTTGPFSKYFPHSFLLSSIIHLPPVSLLFSR